jgi:hypothetical protein
MGPFWLIQGLRAVEFVSEMAGNQTIWYDFVRLCSFMRIAPIIQGTTTANDHFVGISNVLRIPNLRYLPMKPQVDPDPTGCPNIWPCSVEKPIDLQTVLEVITTMKCQFFPVVGVQSHCYFPASFLHSELWPNETSYSSIRSVLGMI